MNITAIQTFLAVVESGNLNKAADRLNVTQSTVTARLDALEAADPIEGGELDFKTVSR